MGESKEQSVTLKKIISILLRVVLVGLGLTFVATQLTWRDSVELPGGYEVDDQVKLNDCATFVIVEHDKTKMTIALEDDRFVTVDVDKLTTNGTGPRFKPGLISTFKNAQIHLVLLGFAITLIMFPVQMARWLVLMRTCDLPSPIWRTFRIYMAGVFFNSFMPGMTGGDLFKAYYVAKESDRRAEAVTSIFVDRFVGLIGLILLATMAAVVALATNIQDVTTQIAGRAVAITAVVMVVGAVLYFSLTLQKILGIRRLMNMLPAHGIIASVQNAIGAYRNHKTALLISTGLGAMTHLIIVSVAFVTAQAVGMDTGALKLFSLMPLVLISGSLPLSFMGLGVMEPTGVALLSEVGVASANQIVTMLVLLRAYQILWSSLGAVFVMRGNLHMPSCEMKVNLDNKAISNSRF